MDYTKLFHDKTAFERECLQQRMELYGFKNMARMELFLWDLELFLQIQKRLGEHIVLKGGAATQFYLPIETQRTSVDIDMIFCGTDEAVKNTLDDITEELKENSEFFRFVEHIPKNPKTNFFAVQSSFEYQLLPISHLFADKFTTIGCNKGK